MFPLVGIAGREVQGEFGGANGIGGNLVPANIENVERDHMAFAGLEQQVFHRNLDIFKVDAAG